MLENFKPSNRDGEKRLVCNHIDGNKLNNKVSNLEWVTDSDNHKHAYKTGLRTHRNGAQKIFEEDILKMEKMLAEGLTRKQISKFFNMTHGSISNLLRKRGHTVIRRPKL
jgi:hypothetical protein